MSPSVRSVLFLCSLTSYALVAACSSRTIPLVINVPTSVAGQASAMEVYVVGGCPADVTRPPVAARAMSSWRRGEASEPLAGSLPERFGVLVIARDANCSVVASRCVAAARQDERVVVDLVAMSGPACAMATCSAGLCVSGDARPLDASPDDAAALIDAAGDAGSDLSLIHI